MPIEIRIPAPNKKQRKFLKSRAKYIAYGGARGGGKSWAVRVQAVRMCLKHKGIVCLIIRKSYPELRQNHIEPLRKMIPKGVANYNDSKKEMRFINGSTILFRYCETERDMERYQGLEADEIFIDEATQFDEKVFRMFCACLRGTFPLDRHVYLTCNPGGRGHQWVKRLFVDRHFKAGENPEDYDFIQAKVFDNTALMDNDPDYVNQLKTLPPKLREAWLNGSFDIFDGQFFEEFQDNPDGYVSQQWTHVIKPFAVPKHWQRYRSFDWGYNKPFSCGWWALSPDGVLYRIAELYGCTGEADEGVKWNTDKVFSEIKRVENEHPLLAGQRIEGVADPAIWQENGGVSIAETASNHGVYFGKGDNKRVPGWAQVHYRFAFDSEGYAMMYVFNTCKNFIRTIPTLVYSDTISEDLDTRQEDHIADETRYMCMLNPVAPRQTVREKALAYNPLETYKEDKYAFYRS